MLRSAKNVPGLAENTVPSLTPMEQATDQFDETRLKEREYLLSEQPRYMKGGSDGKKCIVRHQWILYSNTTEKLTLPCQFLQHLRNVCAPPPALQTLEQKFCRCVSNSVLGNQKDA